MKRMVVLVLALPVLFGLGTAVASAQNGYPPPQTPIPTGDAYPVITPLATAVEPSATPRPSPTSKATATVPFTPAPWNTPTAIELGKISAEGSGQNGAGLLLIGLALTAFFAVIVHTAVVCTAIIEP